MKIVKSNYIKYEIIKIKIKKVMILISNIVQLEKNNRPINWSTNYLDLKYII